MSEFHTSVDGSGARSLHVSGLRVIHDASQRALVRGIDFSVAAGETVAIVGESGSGKSMTARSLLGLLPAGVTASGSAQFGRENLLDLDHKRLRAIRGSDIAMVLQDPFTMLNPLVRTGEQIAETLRAARTQRSSRAQIEEEVARRLLEVGVHQPSAARSYPFELSGGMRQRVGLAAALANDPDLLIADEPTTALDSTTQKEVLRLLRRLQQQRGMGLLLITHDLRVAFSMCDRVIVMKNGEIIEEAAPEVLRSSSTSEYTQELLAAELPLTHRREDLSSSVDDEDGQAAASARSTDPAPEVSGEPLLQVSQLVKEFGGPKRFNRSRTGTRALKGVDVRVQEGRSVGIVGESGSGKTTLARCLLGLETPTSGSIRLNGLEISNYARLSRAEELQSRSILQCVFQDPYSSLNPAHTIGFTLSEAIRQRSAALDTEEAVDDEIARLLRDVGLPQDCAKRLPSALSGGQRQRIAIARALAMRPRILLCDEPVAALDVAVQAQVLQLLRTLQRNGVTLLFITHDLAVVRQMTDDLVVLFRGEVVEHGPTENIMNDPQHDYTKALMAAVPQGSADWLNSDEVPHGG